MTEGNPSSAGWATFEARMRTRRFGRCIERAIAGLETGTLEEVRDALDEARVLCPDAPEIAELEARIAALPSPSATLITLDTPLQEPPAGWLRVMGAMCVLLLLFGLFGFGLTHLYLTGPARTLLSSESAKASPDSNTPIAAADKDALASTAGTRGAITSAAEPPATDAAPAARADVVTDAPVTEAPAPAVTSAEGPAVAAATPPVANRAPRDDGRSRTEEASSGTSATNRGARGALETTSRERTSPASAAAPNDGGMASRLIIRRDPPAAEPSTASSTPPPPAPAATTPASPGPGVQIAERGISVPDSVPALATPSEAATVPAANTTAAADTPVPAVRTSGASSRAEEAAQIRSVLSRYESAYNKLDANAASTVWPNVNQAALDRAFKGLISQRVSLGLCDITVIGDIGGASCAGRARWEPRVGGGLQTAERHWTFNLRKGPDGGWHIEQIRVR